MKNKSNTLGVKLWLASERGTKYSFNILIYRGKYEDRNKIQQLCVRVITRLMNPYLCKRINIITDNVLRLKIWLTFCGQTKLPLLV